MHMSSSLVGSSSSGSGGVERGRATNRLWRWQCGGNIASSSGHTQIFISLPWRKIGRRPVPHDRKWWTRLLRNVDSVS